MGELQAGGVEVRGVFWSTIGVLALYIVGILLSSVLIHPEPPRTPATARSLAAQAYISKLKGLPIPTETGNTRVCLALIFVDANDPIEDLTLPEVNYVCKVIQ